MALRALLRSLVDNMQRRMAEVIRLEGGSIKYRGGWGKGHSSAGRPCAQEWLFSPCSCLAGPLTARIDGGHVGAGGFPHPASGMESRI